MNHPEPNITVNVDVTNPGQFFACCGLLELADRLWPGVEGWFGGGEFRISSEGTIGDLLEAVEEADLDQLDPDDDTASPMYLGGPFDLKLDWWQDGFAGGNRLKVWAGSMRSVRIARAMRAAMTRIPEPQWLLDYGTTVYDPDRGRKKVEPYYFDSRRGGNAQSIDIGFAPDSLKMTTHAFPAVEFLCLIGLQRFRPATTQQRRVFVYRTWSVPLPVPIAQVATMIKLASSPQPAYRFENAFRTDQRKHKSFLPATPLGES